MGVQLPLPAPITYFINPSFPQAYVIFSLTTLRTKCWFVVQIRYSAHHVYCEWLRSDVAFSRNWKMRSVSPNYARIRNAQGIISPPWQGNADVSVIHI